MLTILTIPLTVENSKHEISCGKIEICNISTKQGPFPLMSIYDTSPGCKVISRMDLAGPSLMWGL